MDTDKEILSQLQDMKKQLDRIEKSCAKMDAHVDFVDEIYDRVKSPFHWLMHKIRSFSGIGCQAIQLDPLKKIN